MTDRDKVIKGIEQCTIDYCSDEFETQCEDCPYYTAGITLEECRKELRDDFHALLEEQEAVEPKVSCTEQRCGNCNKVIEMDGWIACPWCGKRIDWESWWKKNDS